MAKQRKTVEEFDSPWKEALHDFLNYFLAFFFPDIQVEVDWANHHPLRSAPRGANEAP